MNVNYVIYGEERATIEKKIAQIAARLHVDKAQISVYDASATLLKVILEDAMSLPLFETHKVVVMKNASFLSSKDTTGYDLDPLLAYAADPLESSTLIMVCESEKLDQRKKAVKQLMRTCEVIRCGRIDEREKAGIISEMVRKRGIKISAEALQLFTARMPNDLAVIENEVEKLSLYGDEIHAEEAEALSVRTLDDRVFDLCGALCAHDLKKAFRLWKDLDAGQLDPIYLSATLAAQFRFLYQVSVLMGRGLSKGAIAEQLHAHPYRVQMTMAQCRALSSDQLLGILKRLADLDQRIKSGRVDKKLGFELFLLSMNA